MLRVCPPVLQVLPGQAPVGMAVLSSALDDMYSACGAVAYDEGLQVVRWGPGSFVLLAPIDAGAMTALGLWHRLYMASIAVWIQKGAACRWHTVGCVLPQQHPAWALKLLPFLPMWAPCHCWHP